MTDRQFQGLIATAIGLLIIMGLASPGGCHEWFLCTFDAQIVPYAPGTARSYLVAIKDDIWRYARIVQPLDLILPLMICLALREGFARWTAGRFTGWLRAAAVLYMVVDYAENAAIHVMLGHPGGDFPDWVAYTASGLTIFKWTVLLPLLLAATLAWLRHRFDRSGAPR